MTPEQLSCIERGRALVARVRNQAARCNVALAMTTGTQLGINVEEDYRLEQCVRAFINWERDLESLGLTPADLDAADAQFIRDFLHGRAATSRRKVSDPVLDHWLETGVNLAPRPMAKEPANVARVALQDWP